MSYNPERVCQYCKSLAHISKYCPENKTCVYCKRDHNIVKCTRVIYRSYGTKGHHQHVCPNKTHCMITKQKEGTCHLNKSANLVRSFKHYLVSEAVFFKRQRTSEHLDCINNISVQSPEHSDKRWSNINEDIRDVSI